MSGKLSESYLNTHDPDYPVQEDLVLYQLFEKARKEGNNGELVSLETMERMTATQVYHKADEYAKGLIALGYTPGEDILTVIGCPGLEAACLFTAATSIGIGYAHPYIYSPMEATISRILPLLESKVMIVGEGHGGQVFTALLTMFDEQQESPVSAQLPDVKYVFYDNSYKDRKPTHKFINSLDKLREYGENVTDEQLIEARSKVKPEHVMHHLFSSGSTGKPKCIAHTHRGLANELLQLRATNIGTTLTMNVNIDEMISYSCISWVLAGKINKVLLTPDVAGEYGPEDFGKACVEHLTPDKVEYLALPSTVQQLIHSTIEILKVETPPMKLFLNGAQLVSRQFKVNLREVFKGIPFTAYGMCETFIIAFTTLGTEPADLELMLEARLYPKPNIEIRLVDENNKVVNIGEEGEIQVNTYSIFKNYRGEADKTRTAFTDDGYFRTGDVGVMYLDGTFIIKGRSADAIRFKVYGDVIYPGPIEEVLTKYPGFKDISVISGGCNDVLGDELTYCIRLPPGANQPSETEIYEFSEENGLDESHRPARILYFDSFPVTANARKVSKKQLREKVKAMIEQDPDVGMTDWFRELLNALANKESSQSSGSTPFTL